MEEWFPPEGADAYTEDGSLKPAWVEAWRESIVDPAADEQAYLREVDTAWVGPPLGWARRWWVIDEARLDGAFPETVLVVVFRVPDHRPGCVFGYRWPLWSDPGQWDFNVVYAHVAELIDAAGAPPLPEDCAPRELRFVEWD